MKIIGETQNGFICELSKTEAANLIGFHSEYSCQKARPHVGWEIQINEMYKQLYQIKAINSHVKAISESAKELAEAVRVKSPVIEPIIAAIELSEGKE